MENKKKIKIEESENVQDTQKRVAYVKKHTSIAVERERDEECMTFPHLIIREVLVFEYMMIILALFSLFFDAPLEEIANPDHSPNPAKAPWYFLGLQELLHYFPPLVAGVVLPVLVVISLVVVPYFPINWKRESFWIENTRKRFLYLSLFVFLSNITFIIYHAVPLYACSIIIYTLMILPLVIKRKTGWSAALKKLPLADWLMIWLVLVSTVLIVIGVFFRGPEWRWIWPWIEGIY